MYDKSNAGYTYIGVISASTLVLGEPAAYYKVIVLPTNTRIDLPKSKCDYIKVMKTDIISINLFSTTFTPY